MTAKDVVGKYCPPMDFSRYLALVLMLCFAVAKVSAQTISVEVDPKKVPVGERAMYKLSLRGAGGVQQVRSNIPDVPGLKISKRPNSQQVAHEVFNGARRSVIMLGFEVIAERKGKFTIPAWDLDVDNRIVRVPATTVEVVSAREAYKGIFDLELHLEKEEFYVGERLNAQLSLFWDKSLRIQVNSDHPPEKEGDGFVQEALENYSWEQQNQVQRGNSTFNKAILNLKLSAIKEGTHGLAYKMPIQVKVSNFGFGRYKNVVLHSVEKQWTVKPLPLENKPTAFSGAVGKFETEVTFTPKQVTAGDPVTLTFTVKGKGNFDRIQPPALVKTDDHNVYPPKIGFEPNAPGNNALGSKTFEYIVRPLHEDADTLMQIPFFYFDPELEIYVDMSQSPGEMLVLPSPEGTISHDSNELVVKAANPSSGNKEAQDTLRLLPIQTESKGWEQPGEISIWTPAYIAVQTASFACLAGVLVFRQRQLRFAGDSRLRRQVAGSKEAKEWRKKTEEALAKGDTEAFLEAACRTIQVSVSKEQMDSEAGALTFADVRQHMESKGLEEGVIQDAQALFDAADRLKFAGGQANGLELESLNKSLDSTLEALK